MAGAGEAPGAETRSASVRALHDAYGAELLAFVRRLTHDPDLAQDIKQEVLVRAWKHPELADRDAPAVRAWLFTVARHLVIDRWRSASARHEVSMDMTSSADAVFVVEGHLGSPAAGPGFATVKEDASAAVLDRWLIADALRSLSAEHRAVVVAAYYEGQPMAEIARRLRVPEGTVKSRLHYGLRTLRLLLQEKGVTAP